MLNSKQHAWVEICVVFSGTSNKWPKCSAQLEKETGQTGQKDVLDKNALFYFILYLYWRFFQILAQVELESTLLSKFEVFLSTFCCKLTAPCFYTSAIPFLHSN